LATRFPQSVVNNGSGRSSAAQRETAADLLVSGSDAHRFGAFVGGTGGIVLETVWIRTCNLRLRETLPTGGQQPSPDGQVPWTCPQGESCGDPCRATRPLESVGLSGSSAHTTGTRKLREIPHHPVLSTVLFFPVVLSMVSSSSPNFAADRHGSSRADHRTMGAHRRRTQPVHPGQRELLSPFTDCPPMTCRGQLRERSAGAAAPGAFQFQIGQSNRPGRV